MATEDYQDFQDTVTELVNEFGWSTAVLTVETKGAYDPSTGTASVVGADTVVDAVLADVLRQMVGTKLQDGSLVEESDKRVLLPVGTTPSLGDKIAFGATKYSILMVKEINPGGTIIVYDMVIRNG